MDTEPQDHSDALDQDTGTFAGSHENETDLLVSDPLDLDRDGFAESVLMQLGELSVLATDLGGDGRPDLVQIDTNGDTIADLVATRQDDGSYLLQFDTDRDGALDTELTRTEDELAAEAPHLADLLADATGFDLSQPDGQGANEEGPVDEEPVTHFPDVVVDGQLVGDPQGDAEFWFEQAANGFCLPASVAQIASEYTGIDYQDESAFVELANEEGMFKVDGQGVPGIAFEDGLTLLQEAGVPATLQYGDLDALSTFLAEGRGIVLFIDSGEVWHGEATEDNAPDHAVVITGIDESTGMVYLSDPGSPTGNMEAVPIETLIDAWQDSEFQMIVCDQPAPTVTQGEVPGDAGEILDDQVPGEADQPWSTAVDDAIQRSAGWAMLPVVLNLES